MLKEEELKYILDDAHVSTIITSPEFMAVINRLKLRLESLKQIIIAGEKTPGAINFSELVSESLAGERVLEFKPDDVATILYTSLRHYRTPQGSNAYPQESRF